MNQDDCTNGKSALTQQIADVFKATMKIIAEKKADRLTTQIVLQDGKYLMVYRHDVPFHDRDRMIPLAAEEVDKLIAVRGLVRV